MLAEAAASVPAWRNRSRWRLGRKAVPVFTNKIQKNPIPQSTEKCKLKSKRETKIKLTTSSTKQYGDRVICLGMTRKLLQTTGKKAGKYLRDAWTLTVAVCMCVL